MTHPVEYHYLDLLTQLLDAPARPDRTGTGTRSIWSPPTLHADLTQGFPLLTSKRVFWRGVVEELLWFWRGDTNVRSLQAAGVHIWDEWADEGGELGPVYGAQWRAWRGSPDAPPIDQLARLLHDLRHLPHSRRHIVSAWNVAALPDMALPPCHALWQCYVDHTDHLHLMLYQRSADVFLGLPFNLASYALLTHLLAHLSGLTPGSVRIQIGDAHLYLNHEAQARQQLSRLSLLPELPTPRLLLTLPSQGASSQEVPVITRADIHMQGYQPLPPIPAPIST